MGAVVTRVFRLCAIALPLLGAAGCTNTVVPPPAPEEPSRVFLLDHGSSSSLVLEREEGITRYSYGHWGWYVENRKGPLRATGALFGNGAAGLGRRHLPGPADLDSVRRQVRVPIHHVWRIAVPAERASALGARLDDLFRERADTLTENPLYDLEFVHHPDAYSLGSNSNHVTARWLRELGCEVRMRVPFSAWDVKEQPP